MAGRGLSEVFQRAGKVLLLDLCAGYSGMYTENYLISGQ